MQRSLQAKILKIPEDSREASLMKMIEVARIFSAAETDSRSRTRLNAIANFLEKQLNKIRMEKSSDKLPSDFSDL